MTIEYNDDFLSIELIDRFLQLYPSYRNKIHKEKSISVEIYISPDKGTKMYIYQPNEEPLEEKTIDSPFFKFYLQQSFKNTGITNNYASVFSDIFKVLQKALKENKIAKTERFHHSPESLYNLYLKFKESI